MGISKAYDDEQSCRDSFAFAGKSGSAVGTDSRDSHFCWMRESFVCRIRNLRAAGVLGTDYDHSL